ncbi:hypothetical protein COT30_04140 [Candidatus Micrarchaeota archaeon CG08_land_8_20_14_0_20_49_17]|nr:MAG: hypothetical protein COT30_04140 [Candidatus Micrarchaeota archaeon CG08_land_8_20_14_0_20_49_17]
MSEVQANGRVAMQRGQPSQSTTRLMQKPALTGPDSHETDSWKILEEAAYSLVCDRLREREQKAKERAEKGQDATLALTFVWVVTDDYTRSLERGDRHVLYAAWDSLPDADKNDPAKIAGAAMEILDRKVNVCGGW